MQHYAHDDPYEREPLDPATAPDRSYHESPTRRPTAAPSYIPTQPHLDAAPYYEHSAAEQYRDNSPQRREYTPYDGSSHNSASPPIPPPPPRHGDYSHHQSSRQDPYQQSYDGQGHAGSHYVPNNISLDELDHYSAPISREASHQSHPVSHRASRDMSQEAYRSVSNNSRIPPPPSRLNAGPYRGGASPRHSGHYPPAAGSHRLDRDSRSSFNRSGGPSSVDSRSLSMADPYSDDAAISYASTPRHGMSNLAMSDPHQINAHEIVDDGDDGLVYGRAASRAASRQASRAPSDTRQGMGAAAVTGAIGSGGAAGAMGRGRFARDMSPARQEKLSSAQKSKRWKWVVIIAGFVIVIGAIVGGVVGSFISQQKKQQQNNDGGFNDDSKGDLDKNSAEIQTLMNNPNLHRVFPGMDYTPMNTQYPDCNTVAPSQNNVTRDIAVLSKLTNVVRLYGTDCNQTEMVLHAIDRLDLKNDMKVWLGVWQDDNKKTNARQLAQMWDILDKYGADPFKGIIVANEILFRQQMTITELGNLMSSVRTNLTSKGLKLPVATSDLGNDWTSALAAQSDYVMANVHPFFSGTEASKSAKWTLDFFNTHDGNLITDQSKGIIAETGWPTAGGKSCGDAQTCDVGAVASIDGLNEFMDGWVCSSLENNVNYFWFSAFDEPWKVRFNTPGKAWEDQWGLMDVNRNIKKGVKIPDCGGKTIS